MTSSVSVRHLAGAPISRSGYCNSFLEGYPIFTCVAMTLQEWESDRKVHYCDVIMGAVASQITNLAIVYSSVSFSHRAKKTSKLRVTGLCVGNSPVTGEFPAQMASNAENVSLWWRHHETLQFLFWPHVCTFLFWMVYGTGALCDLWDKSIVAKWDALITLTSYAYRFISQATRLFNKKN